MIRSVPERPTAQAAPVARPTAEAPPPGAGTAAFRTIEQLAERCGHYCWLENRLFALTGSWASAPGAADAAAGTADAWAAPGALEAGAFENGALENRALEAEVRVACSAMSSWHGFAASAWWDRLPVRAGVDAGALVVPPAGPIGEALDLLAAAGDLPGAFGALVGLVLPTLHQAYDEELARASAVSEAPVRALLRLVRPGVHQEIERGAELLRRRGPGVGAPGQPSDGESGLAGRLQRVLGVESAIFPAARAS